jgi:hypothetical protein
LHLTKDKESVELWQNFVKNNIPNEPTISLVDFVNSNPESAKIWIKEGFMYEGIMDLKDGSNDMQVLERYISNKINKDDFRRI